MFTIDTDVGFDGNKFPVLRGHLYPGSEHREEMAIIMGDFARVATQEVLLKRIAQKLPMPAVIFDWHGLGMSDGDFSDVTVRNLLIDLKRFTGLLMSKGVFKFHLIGHSLAACVIALTTNSPLFGLGKNVLLSPALNQEFLLRYWFAQSISFDLSHEQWLAYNDEGFRLKMRKAGREEGVMGDLWPHEKDFLDFYQKDKEIKGRLIRSKYWEAEESRNYSFFLRSNDPTNLFIYGDMDSTIPLEVVELDPVVFPRASKIEGGDHYFRGHEDEVAEIVTEFLS